MDDSIIVLREILAWMRFQNISALREALASTMSTDNDVAVYELTNGENNQTDIGKRVGISSRAVGYKWEAWRARGLIVDIPDPKTPRHLVSIEDLGGLPSGP